MTVSIFLMFYLLLGILAAIYSYGQFEDDLRFIIDNEEYQKTLDKHAPIT